MLKTLGKESIDRCAQRDGEIHTWRQLPAEGEGKSCVQYIYKKRVPTVNFKLNRYAQFNLLTPTGETKANCTAEWLLGIEGEERNCAAN